MKSLIEKLEKCFSVFMGEKVKSLSRAIDISPAFKTSKIRNILVITTVGCLNNICDTFLTFDWVLPWGLLQNYYQLFLNFCVLFGPDILFWNCLKIQFVNLNFGKIFVFWILNDNKQVKEILLNIEVKFFRFKKFISFAQHLIPIKCRWNCFKNHTYLFPILQTVIIDILYPF